MEVVASGVTLIEINGPETGANDIKHDECDREIMVKSAD